MAKALELLNLFVIIDGHDNDHSVGGVLQQPLDHGEPMILASSHDNKSSSIPVTSGVDNDDTSSGSSESSSDDDDSDSDTGDDEMHDTNKINDATIDTRNKDQDESSSGDDDDDDDDNGASSTERVTMMMTATMIRK